jgi:hypothetical protein
MIPGSELRMNNMNHVDLQQLGKNRVVFIVWIKRYLCDFSILDPHSIPTKDTLLGFLAFSHHKSTTSVMIPPMPIQMQPPYMFHNL